MKFESKLNNKVEKDIEEEVTIKEIEPGIFKHSNNSYELRKEIDEIKYSIDMNKRTSSLHKIVDFPITSGNWDLGFDAEGTHGITNKGLKTYQQIIDQIVILIKKVQSLEKVRTIVFDASKAEFSLEKLEEFQKLLQNKYISSPGLFNGFKCEIKDDKGNFWGVLEIDEGLVVEKSYDKDINGQPTQKSVTTIKDFINDKKQITSILEDENVCKKFVEYLNLEFTVDKKRENKDAATLRADLYERTLKQRFASYKFERENNRIRMYL